MPGTDPGTSLKHDLRRGEIIWVLKQDYPHVVTFRHLQLALRDRNIPLSQRDLESYLSYLEEGGYVRCLRRYDEAESQERILAAALTAKGLLLLDRKLRTPECGCEEQESEVRRQKDRRADPSLRSG